MRVPIKSKDSLEEKRVHLPQASLDVSYLFETAITHPSAPLHSGTVRILCIAVSSDLSKRSRLFTKSGSRLNEIELTIGTTESDCV